VAESVDATDLKSVIRKDVGVRVPPRAHNYFSHFFQVENNIFSNLLEKIPKLLRIKKAKNTLFLAYVRIHKGESKIMKKPLLMCFLLLTLILGACGGGGVEGETVTMTGALIGEDQEGFRANIAAISEATGIEITYQGSDNFEQELQIQIESGDTPDFALWPQPGGVVDAAQRGELVPLEDLGIDIDEYKANFSSYLVGLGTVDGVIYGGANAANLKSIVWYQPAEFEARGYSVPETWDEMIALADQIVSEGMNPFCFGMYSNGASGWLATDWMEDIMLRTGEGTVSYDKWVTNELAFKTQLLRMLQHY
jgi:ABC-type glycerol-3-phosphate transport system substrate-binding protein